LIPSDQGPSQSSEPAEYTGQYSGSASLRALPNYVHRQHLEGQMKERLHNTLEEERDSSRLLVLCGLGGAGKSSLALNYLLSYRKEYSAVFWLHAVSEESLRKECNAIYGLLYGEAHSRSASHIDDVKQWFQGLRSRYLWILDSADNVDDARATGSIDLERYLPDASCVDIIVTTRSQSVQHMSSLPAV
jgi:GTPase SAR1 family protein